MSIRLIRSADYRRMPWKNGGGETVEIAVFPEGAGLDDFEWRISMATVGVDGPFSRFTGIDRTLTVLSGAGMRLEIGDNEPVLLSPGDAPLAFSGDEAVMARLQDGQITDFNVMTRRGSWRHRVRVQPIEGEISLSVEADVLVIHALEGDVAVKSGATALQGDCLIIDRPAGQLALRADRQAVGIVTELRTGV